MGAIFNFKGSAETQNGLDTTSKQHLMLGILSVHNTKARIKGINRDMGPPELR